MTLPSVVTTAEHRRSPHARAALTAAEAARPQPHGLLRRVGRLIRDIWVKGNRDRALGLAAEIAFMAVITIFPILLVVAAVLGQLAGIIGERQALRVEDAVLRALDTLLTDSARPAIDLARQLFETSGDALTFATLLALASLATAFAGVINTVTLVYDVDDPRGWWFRRWLGLLIGLGSVLLGAVVVTLIVVGPLLGRAEDVLGRIGLSQEYAVVWAWARWPVAVVALVVWATTLDHICPDRVGRWRDELPGGVLTALLWLVASLGFSTYLQLVVPKSPVLGALGGGLILMTWFYLLSLALLIGAELNAVRHARREARRRLGAAHAPDVMPPRSQLEPREQPHEELAPAQLEAPAAPEQPAAS